MRRHTWIILAVIGMVVWIGASPAHAQAIAPVSLSAPFPPIASPAVTISILQGVSNVTGTWLPEPNQPVTLVVKVGVAVDSAATIRLVCPDGSTTSPCPTPGAPFNPVASGMLRTSAYPGQCTNFDNPAPLVAASPDFTFDPVTKTLTPTDCGGMAVVQVTPTLTSGSFTFILPQDSNFDGLPDIWQAQYCPATNPNCLTASADDDPAPVILTGSPTGDGIAVFDEYRGFIVSGVHIRTNPTQKDIFVHLVNPQCSTNEVGPASTQSRLGRAFGETQTVYPTDEIPAAALTLSATSGSSVTFTASAAAFNPSHVGAQILVPSTGSATAAATITAFVSATAVTGKITQTFASTSPALGSWRIQPSLFGNLDNLISGTQIHLLSYTPRATHLTPSGEWVDRFFAYTESSGLQYQTTPGATPTTIAPVDDRQINKNAVYPILDTVQGNTIQKGLRITECLDESLTSPLGVAAHGSPNGPGNESILYTKRIVNSVNAAIDAGGTNTLKYSTFVSGAWQTPAPVNGTGSVIQANRDFLISKAMLYYLAMEIGHVVQLTSTVIAGKGGTSYGYHYAPNTGDNLDQAITTKVSSSANTFWIPSLFNTTGQGSFRAKN